MGLNRATFNHFKDGWACFLIGSLSFSIVGNIYYFLYKQSPMDFIDQAFSAIVPNEIRASTFIAFLIVYVAVCARMKWGNCGKKESDGYNWFLGFSKKCVSGYLMLLSGLFASFLITDTFTLGMPSMPKDLIKMAAFYFPVFMLIGIYIRYCMEGLMESCIRK